MSVVNFPKKETEPKRVLEKLMAKQASGRIKAVLCITVEQDSDGDRGICIAHGWDDETLSVYDLLALSGGLDQSKKTIQETLEVS